MYSITTPLYSAPDDIPQPDEVRALIRDIWDLRTAKLRRSVDIMITKQATHSKVSTYSIYMYKRILLFKKHPINTGPFVVYSNLNAIYWWEKIHVYVCIKRSNVIILTISYMYMYMYDCISALLLILT